jgi:hypothetical protein
MAIKLATVQPARLGAGSQAANGGIPRQNGYRISTPLPDMFSTQTIAEALKSWVPSDMFLQRNFFGVERYYTGRYLTIDSRKAKRVVSPVVSRFHPGVVVKRPAIQTTVYDSPKMAPYRVTSLGDLDIRAPGLTATDPAGNAVDVFANILADDTQDLSDIIWRRIELFASQILTRGTVRYRLDGGEYEEFGFGPGVPTVYNPPIPWDQPGALPITDLKNVRSQIIRDTGVAPDVVVFSDRTADLFTSAQQTLDQLNKLHFVVGQLEPTRPAGTAQWLGRLLLPALEMWAYSESYIDEFDGESVNDFIPPWACIVGTTQPSGFTYFGSISQVGDDSGFEEAYGVQLTPRLYYDAHNETAEYRLQARATLCPWDVASWTVINCTTPMLRKNGLARTVSIPTEASEPQPKLSKKGA